MKFLLVSLAICTLFTGCLPPPGPAVVVTPGYHRPYNYGYGYPYGYRHHDEYRHDAYRPYERRDVVVVNRVAPAPRYEVIGRPPYPGARWSAGKWVWINNHWVWNSGHWTRRY